MACVVQVTAGTAGGWKEVVSPPPPMLLFSSNSQRQRQRRKENSPALESRCFCVVSISSALKQRNYESLIRSPLSSKHETKYQGLNRKLSTSPEG